MTLRSFTLVLILVISPQLHADTTLTLPLDGYYRVGRYMPVLVDADGPVEIRAEGLLTTRVEKPARPVVVPVLMLDRDLEDAGFSTTLKPLSDEERLVGVIGLATPDVGGLFPGREVISIRLDLSQPSPGAPITWEALDAIVCGGDFSGVDAGLYRALLGSNVVFAVHSGSVPDPLYPWRREGEWWVLRHESLGPREPISSAAYLPISGWTPGASARTRMLVLLTGVVFAIGAVGATLMRSRRAGVAALAGVVVVATIGTGAWARASRVKSVESAVITLSEALTQHDLWSYRFSDVAAGCSFDFFGNTRPILFSLEQARTQDVSLECDARGVPKRITARLGRGQKLACMSRIVEPTKLESHPVTPPADSPMLPLVRQAYLAPGVRVLGQVDQDEAEGAWPAIVLDRVMP